MITKTLLNNRLVGTIIKLYRSFWFDYRLQDRITEARSSQSNISFPNEDVTLIVVAGNETDMQPWLGRLGDAAQKITEIIWLDPQIARAETAGEDSGRVKKLAWPDPARGRDLNRIIQQAKGSLIVLIDAQVEPSPNWLVNILSSFNSQATRYSLGQMQPVSIWRSLASHGQRWASLPFLGFAFRKQAWAQAGGLPGNIPLHPAWMIFSLRLKSLPGEWMRSSSAVACLRTKANPWLVMEQARQEGQIGLFGDSARKQFPYFCLSLLLILAGSALFFMQAFWQSAILVLCFSAVSALAGKLAVSETGESTTKLHPGQIFLIGLMAQLRVAGYLTGIFTQESMRSSLKKEHENILREIIEQKKNTKGIIVYLPTHDWGFMFQRPQQLARHFAQAGYLYFYCTINEHRDAVVGFQEVEPNLFVCSTPPETFSFIKQPIILIGSPWYAPMLDWFDNPLVIYDHYDDLEVSSARLEDHQRLMKDATLVLATSQVLFDAVKPDRPDALLCPNAVDYAFVQKMRPSISDPAPDELADFIQKGSPIIGYSGALANWFDYELVKGLAKSRPNWQFVLIGIDYDGSLEQSGLLECPNLHYLGWKPYQDLFKYVWRFSVAMIPFMINDITKATSPVKLFEFFACQKTVVATPMPECLRYPEVLVASDVETFASKIEQALECKDDPQLLNQLDAVARLNTWSVRVKQIEQELQVSRLNE
ncbi:MAG: hypothetical protein CVU44_15470 [Chloroflexi bacterium HGW-Chloroflexi-6]|nr:MAG: hypothetical protein CVU44_15470 [Chloroflexi bacterium HGW-Chloroflexi-6]